MRNNHIKGMLYISTQLQEACCLKLKFPLHGHIYDQACMEWPISACKGYSPTWMHACNGLTWEPTRPNNCKSHSVRFHASPTRLSIHFNSVSFSD